MILHLGTLQDTFDLMFELPWRYVESNTSQVPRFIENPIWKENQKKKEIEELKSIIESREKELKSLKNLLDKKEKPE